jgi:hypothetical protein
MTAPVEDVSSLPGQKVTDQEEVPIGEIKEIYATGDDDYPMWVSIEVSSGVAEKRMVFIPLARLKDEDGDLRVPYSKNHVSNSPEIDDSDGISAESDRQLRNYYSIDAADHELRTDNKSYATLVPEEEGEAKRVEDVDNLETPDSDKRTEETKSRVHDPGSSEIRKVNADKVAKGEKESPGNDEEDSEGEKDDSGEEKDDSGEREKDNPRAEKDNPSRDEDDSD